MSYFSFNNVAISGISTAVPKKVQKSMDFAEKYGEDSIKKYIDMTGIEQVRISAKNQTVSDMGFVAAENLIEKKGLNRDDIGLLVFGAHSTDYRRPATACVLHKRLKLSKYCAAFDVSLGCSAFVYTMQIAASMMENSDIQKAIVIVGETVSKLANSEDRSVSMLFGDAGCAILLEKKPCKMAGNLYTDGTGWKAIVAPAGGFRNLEADKKDFDFPDGIRRNLYNVWMDGTSVFTFTISDVPKAIKEFMEKEETSVDNYDYFIMHQANKFIHKQLAKKLKIPLEKIPISLDRYGNTSAASIPLTLCDAFGNEDKIKKIKFLSCGFGVGLSWGVLATEIDTKDIFPIIETDDCFTEGLINSPEDWSNE